MANSESVISLQFKPGFLNTLTSPCLLARFQHGDLSQSQCDQFFQIVCDCLAACHALEHLDQALVKQLMGESHFANPMAEGILSSAMWVQSLCGVPVTSHGFSTVHDGKLSLFIPVQAIVAAKVQQIVQVLIGALRGAAAGRALDAAILEALPPLCLDLQAQMKRVPPNTGYLMCAAKRMHIPVTAHVAQFSAFGQGRHSVILNSSLSATESFFGTTIAKDKILSQRLLRQMGLPVPEQVKVASLDEARSQAERIGYPVVIKPSDLDGGAGVFPFLLNVQDLEAAWHLASAKSSNIILEKHAEGLDYRLLVVKGDLVAAIERGPAQVIGDGTRTIAQLRALENDRRGDAALLLPLPDDAEAEAVLGSQGLAWADIPAQGQIAKLRRAANHAQGGSVSWCLDRVHEDNVKLALHIAEVFHLDAAGIDLISADISRPWHEVPCVVCEVNAQPSMGRPTHHGVFNTLLSKMLPDGSTIPQIAVVGSGDAVAAAVEDIERTLTGRGYVVGSVRQGGTYLDGDLIGRHRDVYQAHRTIVLHPRVTAAVVGITGSNDVRLGLASPVINLVVPVSTGPGALDQYVARNFGGRIVSFQDLPNINLPPPGARQP